MDDDHITLCLNLKLSLCEVLGLSPGTIFEMWSLTCRCNFNSQTLVLCQRVIWVIKWNPSSAKCFGRAITEEKKYAEAYGLTHFYVGRSNCLEWGICSIAYSNNSHCIVLEWGFCSLADRNNLYCIVLSRKSGFDIYNDLQIKYSTTFRKYNIYC